MSRRRLAVGLVGSAFLLAARSPAREVRVAGEPCVPSRDALAGRDVVVVTGSTRGLGAALAQALAERLADHGIRVDAIHPATRMDTPMIVSAGLRPRSTVEQGRDAVLDLLRDPTASTGEFYDGTTRARAHPQAYDASARAKLRELTEALLSTRT